MNTALLWTSIAAVGGFGALARHRLSTLVHRRSGSSFPVGIMVVNLSGSFLLGLLAGLKPGYEIELIFGGGLLGSYTTLSTLVHDTHELFDGSKYRYATLNLAGSLLLGFVSLAIGYGIGRSL